MALSWSPDGEWIATVDPEGGVRAGSVDGEGPLHLGDHEGGAITLAWAPDGRHLASAGNDGIVRLWELHRSPEAWKTALWKRSADCLPPEERMALLGEGREMAEEGVASCVEQVQSALTAGGG